MLNFKYAIFSIMISLENIDYVVIIQETMFPSGSSSGSLCLTSQIVLDSLIEEMEMFLVTFGSNDGAVLINENTAAITILDNSPSERISWAISRKAMHVHVKPQLHFLHDQSFRYTNV